MKDAIEIVRSAIGGIHGSDMFAQGARYALEDVLAQLEAAQPSVPRWHEHDPETNSAGVLVCKICHAVL